MGYFSAYEELIRSKVSAQLADAVKQTVRDVVPQYISRSKFSFTEHVVSLLVGDIQSGKTSHMFGLMCAAADEGFAVFILLTSDSTLLQRQTLERAETDLPGFCVCGESDYLKFANNNKKIDKLKKPAVIVLKKNGRILKQWKENLKSAGFGPGNPLFIVDDEADAGSLNTMVNKNKQSTVNKNLEAIKKTSSCSIYLEVTGTPQAVLLQTAKSGWKPYFIYYFKPGRGYIGGNFLFPPEKPPYVVLTDNDEASDIFCGGGFPENGLKTALITHLITAGHIMLSGGRVCNFLIHPSVKTSRHEAFAEKTRSYMNDIEAALDSGEADGTFKTVYDSLLETKKDILPLKDIEDYIEDQLKKDLVKLRVLNSNSDYWENTKYNTGINVIVGGNSLGRGVTFPMLQTVYYCRLAKNPQADTMWQHARMFGYDRDPELMRVFMPPRLYKLFSDINQTNNSIIKQIESSFNGSEIKIYYPAGLRPTRKNVVDKKAAGIFSGGVNYFPFYPGNKDIAAIDALTAAFAGGVYRVSLALIAKILEQTFGGADDWNAQPFIGFVNAFAAENPMAQGRLIVRRDRDIGKGTGTLLSPDDRRIGAEYPDEVVLTMYKITGNPEKGWDGSKLWIPNIKLPEGRVYYSVENS